MQVHQDLRAENSRGAGGSFEVEWETPWGQQKWGNWGEVEAPGHFLCAHSSQREARLWQS